MNPDAVQATTGSDFGDDPATGNGEIDSPRWPAALPKREAISFLGQALTTGVPKPSYNGPIQRPALPNGRRHVEQSFTLPLDAPLVAQSTLQIGLMWDSVNSIPEPYLETLSPNDLRLVPEDGFEAASDGNQNEEEDPDPLAKTTNEVSPPRGTISRPKLRGILRKEGSSHASASSPATGKDAASKHQGNPSGARRAVKFQLPQGEGESAPPEVVEARPRRIVKIKSRAAVQYLRELEQKE